MPHLWQRLDPDVLIYLDASLSTIRRRGGHAGGNRASTWSGSASLTRALIAISMWILTGYRSMMWRARALTFLNNHRGR